MPNGTKNGATWKWLVGILSAVLITGATAWFSIGSGYVKKADFEQIIDLREKNLKSDIQHNAGHIRELKTDVREVKGLVQEVLREVKK